MFTRRRLLIGALFGCLGMADTPAIGAEEKWNVLLLMADDWRPELACYGVEGMITPNIDRLAAGGVRFERAFCQFPVCNASRSSMLTGHCPNVTKVVFNGSPLREFHPGCVTLPELFRKHGYVTATAGKIFHGRFPDPPSWDEQLPEEVPAEFRRRARDAAAAPSKEKNKDDADDEGGGGPAGVKFVMLEGDGESDRDYHIAEGGIRLLEKYQDRPFFIGVGFHRPHAIPTAPRRFYDMYDTAKMPLAVDFAPRPTLAANVTPLALPEENDTYMQGDTSPETARQVLRAYRASASWTDWNMGRVLDALERLGLAERTIVVFCGDHGYHNGEKGRWGKTTVFDIATRVPLVIRVPGAAGNGKVSPRTVQLLDIYPTLAELCGLPPPSDLQGHSLKPLLANPSAAWPHAAFTMAKTGGHPLAYSVHTERWHYADWGEGKLGAVLYDTVADPHELDNLAADPRYADEIAELKRQLKSAFGSMPSRIPRPTAAAAPGS
jgi:arylsulfatase A-like enzyme